MASFSDIFADGPQDRSDFVDERDLLELLNSILDEKDFYKDQIREITTLKKLSVTEAQVPLSFDLQDLLRGADLDQGVAHITTEVTSKEGVEQVETMSISSMDDKPITIDRSGSGYIICKPDSMIVVDQATFTSILNHFRDTSGSISFSRLQAASVESSAAYDFFIEQSNTSVDGNIIELETPTDTVFSFEITIQRPYPNGDMVGTKLTVQESVSKHSAIGVDQIAPEHTVRMSIRRQDGDEVTTDTISIEALEHQTSFLVEKISKTEIEDIIEALFIVRSAK